jgi:hypothetical protein
MYHFGEAGLRGIGSGILTPSNNYVNKGTPVGEPRHFSSF